ncbi:MAG: hypothetical protein K2J49_08435 [Muribaculaceae bacterium]|nr:hypothetical protein [Muribaculaceae bacterium]
MPLYRISVKNPCYRAGQCIEPGMSVEISSMFPIVSVNSSNSSKVAAAFKSKYGVDLNAMGCINMAFLQVDRI